MHHGDVVEFQRVNDSLSKIVIDYGLGSPNISPEMKLDSVSVRIYRKTTDREEIKEAKLTFTIERFDENLNFIVKTPEDAESEPRSGDFFILDKVLCVSDPYLLSGKWLGTENEIFKSKADLAKANERIMDKEIGGKDVTPSKHNLYYTTENIFHDEGVFTGCYILTRNGEATLHNTGQNLQSEVSGENETEWNWIPFPKARTESSVLQYYPDYEVRPNINGFYYYDSSEGTEFDDDDNTANFESSNITNDEEAVTAMKLGSEGLYNSYIAAGAQFIRLEISIFGNSFKSNWHSPILKRSWLKQGDSYFDIIGQPDGGTIDVSLYSVFGGKTLNLSESFTIFNQFGWFINEHHFFGQPGGTTILNSVKSFSGDQYSPTLTCNLYFNYTTLLDLTRYFEPEYFDGENSFKNRFFKEHDHKNGEPLKFYEKFKNWGIVSEDRKNLFLIKPETLKWINPADENEVDRYYRIPVNGKIQIQFQIEGGLNFALLFEKSSFFDLVFQGDSVVEYYNDDKNNSIRIFVLSETSDAGPSEAKMRVSGAYYSPLHKTPLDTNAIFGICDNSYWGWAGTGVGNTSSFLSSPVHAHTGKFFVSAPSGVRSVDYLFNEESSEDLTLYKDAVTNRLSLIRGREDNQVSMIKQEIVIGRIQGVTATGNPMLIDGSYERLHGVNLIRQSGKNQYVSAGFEPLTFEVGASVFGNGTRESNLLIENGIDVENNPEKLETTLYGGHTIRKSFDFSSGAPKFFPIGISTKQQSFVYFEPSNMQVLGASYVNHNQTINNNLSANLHLNQDSEMYVVYGQKVGEITLGGTILNSKYKNNVWENSSNGVFIIGSRDFGESWGAPHGHGEWNEDPKLAYPVMILHGCDYLDSIYNQFSNTLGIFVKCFDDNKNVFIGYYRLSELSLREDLFFATDSKLNNSNQEESEESTVSESDYDLSFNYRLPKISYSTTIDPNKSFTSTKNIITQEYNLDSSVVRDFFTRIIGNESTKSQIVSSEGIGTFLQAKYLIDNRIVVTFNDNLGVRMMHSQSDGTNWELIETILVRDGVAPVFLDNFGVAFISDNEIKIKMFSHILLEKMILYCGEIGENQFCKEETQKEFDEIPTYSIGSGSVSEQKMSLQSKRGSWYISYYVGDSLTVKESQDGINWIFSNNF